jgi:general secretion pathway protein E
VLTTVHANSLFDVTGRFRHFGLDMFGLMSALNGVIVQRLVRTLCPSCASTRPATAREQLWLAKLQLQADRVAQATGCTQCHGTGYRGRTVIAEVHAIDDRFRDLVTGQAPVSELRAHVAAAGHNSLATLSARLMMHGRTTPEEIKRVVGFG